MEKKQEAEENNNGRHYTTSCPSSNATTNPTYSHTTMDIELVDIRPDFLRVRTLVDQTIADKFAEMEASKSQHVHVMQMLLEELKHLNYQDENLSNLEAQNETGLCPSFSFFLSDVDVDVDVFFLWCREEEGDADLQRG